jgi:hypothetical protein
VVDEEKAAEQSLDKESEKKEEALYEEKSETKEQKEAVEEKTEKSEMREKMSSTPFISSHSCQLNDFLSVAGKKKGKT